MDKLPILTIAISAALASCGPLPDQNTIPPNVRVTFYSGSQSGGVDQINGLPTQHVSPTQPFSVVAEGFSSLAGMQSIELDPSESFTCTQRDVASGGTPDDVPKIVMAPPGPPTLKLTAEIDFGAPSSYCKPGWQLKWGGSFTATAKSRNGLSTTSKKLPLASP